jgi:pyruvate/2-oxoglutarate/acetoin dehydrogenase E1 component
MDCLEQMRAWMIRENIATEKQLDAITAEAEAFVEEQKQKAWQAYLEPIEAERKALLQTLSDTLEVSSDDLKAEIQKAAKGLEKAQTPSRKLVVSTARQINFLLRFEAVDVKQPIQQFIQTYTKENEKRYNSKLFVDSHRSALNIGGSEPIFDDASAQVDGRQIIQQLFDHHLSSDPRLFIIGEDVGKLGGVNLEFDGLSDKHGEHRVTDTGIREATILGQGIGAALRGLRPIVDIQYLDYLLYAFQIMSDDLASLHYRTAGGQSAPVIVRTKGHRLEGVWHSGSPLGTIIHGSRGMHVCVPRNMLQAAGMYNTLLKSDDPALVIEVLNGYRLKETIPENLADYHVALGVCDILEHGSDITVVSYGACLNVIQSAIPTLKKLGIDIELIDIQTLLPFDRFDLIKQSLEKTHALLVVDEDVPGGASSFMLQQIIERQAGYDVLDAPPRTLTAKEHRSPYGSDGDYFTKPSKEDVIEMIYEMMRERDPKNFPSLF